VAFIETIAEDEAVGPVAELYEQDRANSGYVWNATKVFSPRPEAYAAWRALVGAVKGNMDTRRYELATLAAARRLRSSYCALAHGKILVEEFLEPAAVRDAVDGHRSPALDPVDVAVMDFAAKVAGDATSVSQEDVDELRRFGLTDAEVLDVALTAAMRCFFSKTLDAMGAQPDAQLAALDPEVRDALTVGRPIADP
jgi:uncharacterized peroxidase-related enzyme